VLKSCVPDIGETIMVRLLTAAAILGLLLAPPLGAQTSRPCAVGGSAAATAPKDILDKQDDTFIKQAAAGGMAEVELSKIAEKSENTEIKLFAERMVRDHTAANVELTDIATALCAEVPTTLDTDHQRIRDQLRTAHGGAFDQQYMHVMVGDHDQADNLFRQEADLGHEPQLRQFAQKTLPAIEEHQKKALELSHRLDETASR
jgi:putative membrane protein